MTQDGSMQSQIEHVAQSLAPCFDEVRLNVARVIAEAKEGRLIDQTERVIFDELNRLRNEAQEVGLQERAQQAEAAFSPSSEAAEASLQRHRSDDASDAQWFGDA